MAIGVQGSSSASLSLASSRSACTSDSVPHMRLPSLTSGSPKGRHWVVMEELQQACNLLPLQQRR